MVTNKISLSLKVKDWYICTDFKNRIFLLMDVIINKQKHQFLEYIGKL